MQFILKSDTHINTCNYICPASQTQNSTWLWNSLLNKWIKTNQVNKETEEKLSVNSHWQLKNQNLCAQNNIIMPFKVNLPSDWLQHVELLKEDIMHTTEKQLISGFGGMHIRLLSGGNRGKPIADFDLQLTLNVMHKLALAELSCLGKWGLFLHASLRKHMRWLGVETICVMALLHVKECKPPKLILLPEFSHIYSHSAKK